MSLNLNNYIYLFLISIIITLGCMLTYNNAVHKRTVHQLNEANLQLQILQQQALIQQQKIDEANQQSKIREKITQEKLRSLMKTAIPKDCQQSIQWGIQKASEF